MIKAKIHQMIRVNLAGEYGAMRIYQGQIDAMKKKAGENKECLHTLAHMRDQELRHLEYFQKSLVKNRVRPTALQPVWHVLGYALGYVTASISKESAMACTVAVEEVIDEHYAEQLEELDHKSEPELHRAISDFREEELQHRDTALENQAQSAPCYNALHFAIQSASKAAIWLSKRI